MTEEERQKLVADLRQIAPDLLWSRATYACNDAADEIERLARRVEELEIRIELMKSDAMGDDA
jgi:uncharacterized protein with PhoU and TrkA domain